ncbi:GTPase activating protein (SH3 domain) binding protein [Datura stramonium]|uniref:GTPase activating protein (SH3 domain) binding protein n=1 Tax=Datura stramonium TaxID=4076 RepID=A0ABS8WVC5_DATST|nr:GTPase activating protein (SH3 domain) binding protein [Datura stramonium]
MTTQTTIHSAETIAFKFVDQYYRVLQKCIDQAYRFYKEKSVISWTLLDGKMKCLTTFEGINEFIISSHFKDNKVEVKTIDSQSSATGGILVVVTACLIGQADSRKNFSQTFFLAPQEIGYYVLNDIFRFVDVEESSTIIEEKIDEKTSVASLATESGAEDTIKRVSYKLETKVSIDDQVIQKPSITSSEKQKSVVETIPIIQNEDSKVSYASMVKQARSSPPQYKIVRVVTDAGLPSSSKKPQPNVLVQALTSSSSGVSKAIVPSANAPHDDFYDDILYKSVFIGGLPTNITRSDLYAAVKEFGRVHAHDIHLKSYEEGYCSGFVHFQDEVSAQNAVRAHHIIVKGREAYIRFMRLNKGRSERKNSPSDRGEFHNSGSESRSRPQKFDGHRFTAWL